RFPAGFQRHARQDRAARWCARSSNATSRLEGGSKPMQPSVIHIVAGARPNFLKAAPLLHALKAEAWAQPLLVHTGQHYDIAMSYAFFHDLNLPAPDFHLGVGSGSHAEQTARVMVEYEKVCLKRRPHWTVVIGDVNSTLAASLVASKLSIP